MMNNENKGRLRKLALSNRDKLSPRYREEAGEKIAEKLLELPQIKSAAIIMCYSSFRSEVPTARIVEMLQAQGKKLCFPLCEKGGIMQAYHPFDENSWQKGMMGITEPVPEKSELIDPEDIELVICPMVAFDSMKHRMGYGGGYYDRYLPKCKKALRVGIAFQVQRTDSVPLDEYDQSMDIIVTESARFL